MSDRNQAIEHDTEDKNWWCQLGVQLENRFVDICRTRLSLAAQINPEKATNPYAPDLVVDGRLADLKVQHTPFFTAGRQGFDPRYAVTFNRKDYERYKRLYPQIDIYFWVDWKQLEWKGMSVKYLAGIFVLPFSTIAQMIESNSAAEHSYIHRVNDTGGNAKSSFLLDIRRFKSLFQTE